MNEWKCNDCDNKAFFEKQRLFLMTVNGQQINVMIKGLVVNKCIHIKIHDKKKNEE